jgi:hypothetical protein
MTPKAPPKDNILKHAGFAFLIALLGYIFFYSCDAHLRTHKGAWIVNFQSNTNGEPLLVIDQPFLKIITQILLAGEKATNTPGVVEFKDPQHLRTPFGRVRFHDLTYLPGTIVLDVYGHEVELLPRTLVLNTKEIAWTNNITYVLAPTNKIPGLKDRDYKGRR